MLRLQEQQEMVDLVQLCLISLYDLEEFLCFQEIEHFTFYLLDLSKVLLDITISE